MHLQVLIKNLLEVDVDKRFNAQQLLEYHWIAVRGYLSSTYRDIILNHMFHYMPHGFYFGLQTSCQSFDATSEHIGGCKGGGAKRAMPPRSQKAPFIPM